MCHARGACPAGRCIQRHKELLEFLPSSRSALGHDNIGHRRVVGSLVRAGADLGRPGRGADPGQRCGFRTAGGWPFPDLPVRDGSAAGQVAPFGSVNSPIIGVTCNEEDKMLITTYALTSLSVEQKRVYNLLSTVQQLFQNSSTDSRQTDPVILESVVSQLAKLDESCHRRKVKVDVYLIPAIQKATKEADSLLAELESLSAIGLGILGSVMEWMRQGLDQGVLEVKALYSSIELYCNNLLQRLTKEEDELLPLAQRVISSEGWFAIGAQFLSLDAERKARK
jgi:hemerythrin-like domain-containing protein